MSTVYWQCGGRIGKEDALPVWCAYENFATLPLKDPGRRATPSKRIGRLPREWVVLRSQVPSEEDREDRLEHDGRRGPCAFRQSTRTGGYSLSPFSENRTFSPICCLHYPDALRTSQTLGEGTKPSKPAFRPNCWHFELHSLPTTGGQAEQSGLHMMTGERSSSTTPAGAFILAANRNREHRHYVKVKCTALDLKTLARSRKAGK
jgi:hypothetical protein